MKKKKVRRQNRRQKKRQKNLRHLITLAVFLFALIGLSSIVVNVVGVVFLDRNTSEVQEPDTSKEDFISELVPVAQSLRQEFGVLPSIILGQAILESDWGRSELAAKYHNLFGVKNHEEGKGVILKTKEFENNQWIEIDGNFKVYDSWADSMRDHSLLFVNGVSWDPTLYHGVLSAPDYREASLALERAGYATDPDYASKIISVIETYQLSAYD
ncbi:glycoside hydrolase family 73 protein [Vagococcus elongatus]|uniref:Mannosyl-glycoprotein endo-beta-N-acetylglucosamidase-like domain-containing protein n=1 Tax=Vagococcus elongatus TaxID=180344 RepID=A0A430ANQ1_9ENTE|nr:glycoside hydrolase family 73 protein [Vagococcus elongatus]RSU09686.1 hypothetical protein CBF29_10940 [Vagococcus elongatus]